MRLKYTIITLLFWVQSSSFAKVLAQTKEISKGQIINIENPSKKSGVYKYVFREGSSYGVKYLESDWYYEIRKSDGLLKSGTNLAGEDKVFSNFSLYVDTVFIKGNKKFVECYIINIDGFYDVSEKRFFISNLNKALSSGEIAPTTIFYSEPYSFKHPIRAVKRFVNESSLPTLIKCTFIYSLIIIFLIFLYQRIALNREVKMGLVSDLDPEELLRSDINRYWLYRLYDANPKLGLLFWDWKNDESKLMKGNSEYLKKYNVSDIQQVKEISDLISKVKDKDSTLSKEWDKVDSNMESAIRAAKEDLKASNISTKDLDASLKRFHSSEQEKNLKLLISYLKKITNKGFHSSN
jgi:hypothetical protein